jgi:4-hydroxy-tetrahydrodipicolinate synthase
MSLKLNEIALWTALVTPFKKNDASSLDQRAFENLIRFQVDAGVKGLLLFGSTGEAATLSVNEKEQLALWIRDLKGEARVMMGVTHNDTKQALENVKRACDWGADVLLVAPPYYNKPTEAGLLKHFTALHEASDLPLVLYNIPSRVGVSMSFELIRELAALPRVMGLKEASADLFLATRVVGLDLNVWSGDDPLLLPYMSVGALGGISVNSNLFPNEFLKMIDFLNQGKRKEALALTQKMADWYPIVFSETNPLGIKTAMACRGLLEAAFRLPLCPMSTRNATQIEEALKSSFSS